MKRVLVAIPYKHNLHPFLADRMRELVARLHEANPGYELDVCMMSNQIVMPKGGDPFSRHAYARNMLLDNYLDGHDLVMWIDADLVDYPADIITRLDKANPGGITAPMVMIEGTSQFYDTYGYRQNGKPISHIPPYFAGAFMPRVELDEVGCAYLIPGAVYEHNRYETMPGHTEHASIMRASGLRIVCDTNITIYHADLPKYGEGYHGH